MYSVGIDWADTKFDVCILDPAGEVLLTLTVKKTVEGFLDVLDRFRTLAASVAEFQCLIETPHSPLVDFLIHHGYAVFHINPKTLDACRARYTVSQAKSDAFDAYVLADVMRTDRRAPHPICLGSELSREIALLTADLRGLIMTKSALEQTLLATLKEYYPLFVGLFRDTLCPTALAFLQHYPTYALARQVAEDDLRVFFKEHGYSVSQHIHAIFVTLQGEQIPIEPVVVRTKSRKAQALVVQIQQLLQTIREYEAEIWRLVNRHPDKDVFDSLPGAGTRLTPELLGAFGDNRDRFQTYQEVQQYAGSAPVTVRSGNYVSVRFRTACHKRFRTTLQQFAFSSLKECVWANSYYTHLKARGKTHQHALRCVANKWVKIIFTMWKTHTPYDEEKHLAQMTRQRLAAQG
jgi:transposase